MASAAPSASAAPTLSYMAGASNGPSFDGEISLKSEWQPFDLLQVGGEHPKCYRRGDLCIISGCVTTISPMKNQAGWDLTLGWVDSRCTPTEDVPFLAPTAMSRYEGIYQCGTSAVLKKDAGKLTINFNKNTNPMVLHFSGFCCAISQEEPEVLDIAQYQVKSKPAAPGRGQRMDELGGDEGMALKAHPENVPGMRMCGRIVMLQGELQEATFGSTSQLVCRLPEGRRPKRELRWLVLLTAERDDSPMVVEHTVALTVHPDGRISVQGGKMQMTDQKGNIRLMSQKKKGQLRLDGVRFSLDQGVPVELCSSIKGRPVPGASSRRAAMFPGLNLGSSAACIRQGDVVLLEGHISWDCASRPPNAKQPLAKLPKGCWPRRRETFFTRGGCDTEERRRVDVDQFGRIFCPEGITDGRLELTGILFVAQAPGILPGKPRDPEWDDLGLQYRHSEVNVASTAYEHHELLEAFVNRNNIYEWQLVEFDLRRHAGRGMMMPLGPANLRGKPKDPQDLGERDNKIFKDYQDKLVSEFGISSFHTLYHLSDRMFEKVAEAAYMTEDHKKKLRERREKLRDYWDSQRRPGMTFAYFQDLASQIVEQMFAHWDFDAQLKGALQNDFRPPASIERLLPPRRTHQDRLIEKHIERVERPKFDEIRKFFLLYETTGNNITHCSLMGAQDIFTTTGKWHFPDSPDVQRQLFTNIAWLFPRGLYMYISERQTQRFPFIEDLDVQCREDWDPCRKPPDHLLMTRPQRVNGRVSGDPGELLRKRAMAVHMIYPHLDHLEVLVYTASGLNKGKEMLKSSFHLVWPQLIVDPDRAPVIRHATLGVFARETAQPGSYLSTLQARLIELHESNNWELVFDNTTIHARNGLRLPYSDKASMVIKNAEDKTRVKQGLLSKNKAEKTRVKEDRPSQALGRIRFEFKKDPETGDDHLVRAEWVEDRDSHSIAEWIQLGTCRRDPNAMVDLTPWQIGPDVLELLPKKPGEEFFFNSTEDNGQGHWVTHKPYPNICRFNQSTREFVRKFDEAVRDEQEELQSEGQIDLLQRVHGSWISITESQAIWRTTASAQFDRKVPDRQWGQGRMQRSSEVVYVKSKGKVIIDGPWEVRDALVRAAKTFARDDDNAVMPIYDLTKMHTG